MKIYLVKDKSSWMSGFAFKSQDDAIISQKWRLDEPASDVWNDYPLIIVEVDTVTMMTKEVMQLCEDELRNRVVNNNRQKKGGSR